MIITDPCFKKISGLWKIR